jgi:tetratricopeptide (TPR) repeat protein
MPLPYPHRATFIASTLILPLEQRQAAAYFARLLSVMVFDQFLRHPVVTLGDDDERVSDDQGRLLDAAHPQVEDSLDWLFRVARRHEVLWFELSFDRARPRTPLLRARGANGSLDEWTADAELPMSQQLDRCLAQWLLQRRLPPVPALPAFTIDDVRDAAQRLTKAAAMLSLRGDFAQLPFPLVQPLPRLAVPYLRVLTELAGTAARSVDPMILAIDPTHPVARRNAYVSALASGQGDRRDILPLVTEAPMYGKPHLSIWGEPFASDRPLENMGVRHQGIAASLIPANPYACHNYSLQLAEQGRLEESYRWADRASVASPDFAPSHIDCVRSLRKVGRAGQAFAEAQYRCREILDRAHTGKLSTNDWQAPHNAAMLVALAHFDVGRFAEAIALAEGALGLVPADAASQEAFAWAKKRVSHWKSDAGLLARAYAWEGYYRGDPGRAVAGLSRGRLTDDEDVAILIESLVAVGREDQARVAAYHGAGIDGIGVLGDSKARLAAAYALLVAGELEAALEHVQIAQLRRAESRLEGEINRWLRLAATYRASDWERVIERKLALGAVTLARRAARDLADFVPGLDTPIVQRALGTTKPVALDPRWFKELIGGLPAAQTSAAILKRLARPDDDSLAAADRLAHEWWSVLVPATKDRDAHANGAVLALGVALAQYFAETTATLSPIAGAYRCIATEALHIVRRARYQIEPSAIRALLALVDKLSDAPEWLLDTWLLRIERALDLEAEHGSYLDTIVAGLPRVQRLLRGDERVGWELRFAHDLASEPTMFEPAAALFERCSRAVEAGGSELAWSAAATGVGPAEQHLDVHWLAALANPSTAATPWLAVAKGLFVTGKREDAFTAACRAATAATVAERPAVLAELGALWKAAKLDIPFDGIVAFESGIAAVRSGQLDVAVRNLTWAHAALPGDPQRAQALAMVLARTGRGLAAVRVLAANNRGDGPRLVGIALAEAQHYANAIPILRFASRRFTSHDDWGVLALCAARADDDVVTVEAGRRALALGSTDVDVMTVLATGLYRLGEFVECERVAQALIGVRNASKDARAAGLHAMARALAGQGRHVDAHPYAKEAARMSPNGELAADLAETMDRIVAQQIPPVLDVSEHAMERTAWADLEAGRFDSLVSAVTSPSWRVTRAALVACEFRREEESGLPVSPRALEASLTVLARTVGATDRDAVLARVRALRIRDNAFIQLDPPPPLGTRMTTEEFERTYRARSARPQRPSVVQSYAR